MNFYVEEYKGEHIKNKIFPCVVLTTDPWDDNYFAETLFHAKFVSVDSEIKLGDVKIMSTKTDITRNVIDKHFNELDDTFCSLGQDLIYYKKISELPRNLGFEILKGLRDAATNESIASKFQFKNIFINSLLRFSQAEKAFKEAKKYFGSEINKVLNFSFNYKLEGATDKHQIDLDFRENKIPYRINVFVGKNATGKTKILTELSSLLSGVKINKNNFNPERPSFNKILTISYSAFDELYKPFENIKKNEENGIKDEYPNEKEIRKDENKLFSYVYCGLRKKDGLLTIQEMENNFFLAFDQVEEQGRIDQWEKIMKNIFEEEHFKLIEDVRKSRYEGKSYSARLSSKLSSGQNILLSTMTEVIAHIDNDSIILFDEPEIHLHPNAIANFMRMFYQILNEFNSYAIISTHSPIILQEIPSKYIRVFLRFGNTPLVSVPSIECFGENISNITNDVFDVREFESNYKSYFRHLSEQLSKEEIIDLFEEELSFNALTYLNSLFLIKGDN